MNIKPKQKNLLNIALEYKRQYEECSPRAVKKRQKLYEKWKRTLALAMCW